MFATTPVPKKFGAKLGLFYVLTLIVLLFVPALLQKLGIHNGQLLDVVSEAVTGIFMIGLTIGWFHLPIFSKPRHFWTGVIAVVLMISVNLVNNGPLPDYSDQRLISALLFGLAVGIFEEPLVRGPLLFWVWSKTPKKLSPCWWTSIITAIIFGCLHLFNLHSNPDPKQVLIQIGYTTAMGFGAAALFFTTHNLGFTIVWHGLLDASSYYWSPIPISTIGNSLIDRLSLLLLVVTHITVGIVLLHRITSNQKKR
ncbi:MAG: CPBP family intramembrane metalloprotease [Lactobacillus sp.]|jgi:membrane protease YdiL (CAAX protease family)|nr:CPBP family intramembrane metalloprotease [Lactobacillus sp.]